MKTLSEAKVEVSADGKSVTITADIVEAEWSTLLTSRTTQTFINPNNMHFVRSIQCSNQAIFIQSAHGTIAIPNDVIVHVGYSIEPKISFAPVFKPGTIPPNVEVLSELPVSYQWEVSDNAYPKATKPHTPAPEAVWTKLEGQTSQKVDESVLEKIQSKKDEAVKTAFDNLSKAKELCQKAASKQNPNDEEKAMIDSVKASLETCKVLYNYALDNSNTWIRVVVSNEAGSVTSKAAQYKK